MTPAQTRLFRPKSVPGLSRRGAAVPMPMVPIGLD